MHYLHARDTVYFLLKCTDGWANKDSHASNDQSFTVTYFYLLRFDSSLTKGCGNCIP